MPFKNKKFLRMGFIGGLCSLLLAACVIEGVSLAPSDVEATVAAAIEATMTGEETSETITEETSVPEDPSAEGEPPMLITPTPDQSAEIAQYIAENTRHFRGNPDADVVLIEFSNFQ